MKSCRIRIGLAVAGFLYVCVGVAAPESATVLRQNADSGFSVQGTVRIPGTREPLAGVEVHVLMNERSQGGALGGAQTEATTMTDANGRFRLTDLPAGSDVPWE
jgi:Carboxypeptidase regulatory-like domain